MTDAPSNKRIVVLAAPSGAGKTTIARGVMAALPQLRFSVSATTRPPRTGERDGVDYHFMDLDEFQHHIERDEMLEYEQVYPGRFYGTLRREVERSSPSEPVLLDIDVHGALTVKRLYGNDARIIFIKPPSEHDLERRLRNRATEDEETIQVRMKRAREELAYADEFDVAIVNDDLQTAVEETLAVIRQFLNN